MPVVQELHELDPVRGLPEYLPEGEAIIWQGQPRWWSLCRRVFHIEIVSAYFLLLVVWDFISPPPDQGQSLWIGIGLTLFFGALAVATFMGLAALMSRTTIYTITNRRVAMQFGVALPINLNLPFTQIEAAGHRRFRDGTGDIPLQLSRENRIAYLVLWPHARPWRISRPEPMLRCLPDSAAIAAVLSRALQEFHGQQAAAGESAETADPRHDVSASAERVEFP